MRVRENKLCCAADESAGAKEPSSASTPDALSPMPSQAIDAKPLVIDDTAERCE